LIKEFDPRVMFRRYRIVFCAVPADVLAADRFPVPPGIPW
jgi:hypothetical protein